jgi:hypothetical protein
MKYNKFLFLILLLLVTAAGCSDGYEYNDANPFVGRWQEIARGNEHYPELEPLGVIMEFFEDGTATRYSFKNSIYWTDAEFIYIGLDTVSYNTFRYTFSGRNTVRMDHVGGYRTSTAFSPLFYVYKRIKK